MFGNGREKENPRLYTRIKDFILTDKNTNFEGFLYTTEI